MRAIITFSVLVMWLVAPSLYAQGDFSRETPRFYFGIDLQTNSTNFSQYETEYDDALGATIPLTINNSFSNDGEVSGLGLKFGFHFTNFFAAEVQYVKVQEVELDTGEKFNIDLMTSAFFRFDLPFRSVVPYLLAGGTYMNWRYEDPTGAGLVKIRETTFGPAFGGGVEIYGGEYTAFNINWTRYMFSPDGLNHDAISFGIVHWFEFPSLYRRF